MSDILVDRQPFDLMEHRGVGLIIIGAVNTTGADDADRGAVCFQAADLHGAGMGAQHASAVTWLIG